MKSCVPVVGDPLVGQGNVQFRGLFPLNGVYKHKQHKANSKRRQIAQGKLLKEDHCEKIGEVDGGCFDTGERKKN